MVGIIAGGRHLFEKLIVKGKEVVDDIDAWGSDSEGLYIKSWRMEDFLPEWIVSYSCVKLC